MYYEVFIPSTDDDGYDVTITVDAENWMFALKSGLERIGDGQTDVSHVMCDIKDDNTIHVTDSKTDRVFVMRKLEEAEVGSSGADVRREKSDQQPRGEVETAGVDGQTENENESDGQVVSETKEPSRTDISTIGRAESSAAEASDDILTSVFMRTESLIGREMELKRRLDEGLQMASTLFEVQRGGILFVDDSGKELYFGAAIGPDSERLMTQRLTYGKGVAGFCVRFGVGVAVSDIARDPRFYREVERGTTNKADAILCAPIQHDERTFGCIEMVAEGRRRFDAQELHALTFLGRKLGYSVNRHLIEQDSLDLQATS